MGGMMTKCSSGYVKVGGDGQYNNRGQGGGDPRFGGHGSSGGGGMVGTNSCIPIPVEGANNSHFEGNSSTGLQATNVFDTTANRLGFISPVHT